MDAALTDADAIVRSMDDPRWFAIVYRRHLSAVARYLTRRVGREAAEDLTAELFLRAFDRRGDYEPVYASAFPWLMGFAGRLTAEHRRYERRRLDALARLASVPREHGQSFGAALAPELIAAVGKLSRADRDTLLLVVWGELSYEEAAFAIGVPVGTVRSRIARARQRLSEAITAPTTAAHTLPEGGAHARS